MNNDITYEDLYTFLNCLEVSPCWGWMNSNATWRQRTTERAYQLNNALQDLVANNTFENMTVVYVDYLPNVLDYWTANGGEIWQLIEPVDGFHPNQIANALSTAITWNLTLEQYPQLIPNVNPHNEEIQKIFGDQGGY